MRPLEVQSVRLRSWSVRVARVVRSRPVEPVEPVEPVRAVPRPGRRVVLAEPGAAVEANWRAMWPVHLWALPQRGRAVALAGNWAVALAAGCRATLPADSGAVLRASQPPQAAGAKARIHRERAPARKAVAAMARHPVADYRRIGMRSLPSHLAGQPGRLVPLVQLGARQVAARRCQAQPASCRTRDATPPQPRHPQSHRRTNAP